MLYFYIHGLRAFSGHNRKLGILSFQIGVVLENKIPLKNQTKKNNSMNKTGNNTKSEIGTLLALFAHLFMPIHRVWLHGPIQKHRKNLQPNK